MAGVDDHTEFNGGGVMPNTVFPKSPEFLTNGEKLRLDAITGQHEDSHAPVNPYHWNGVDVPDPQAEISAQRRLNAQSQAARKQEQLRYREGRTYGLN